MYLDESAEHLAIEIESKAFYGAENIRQYWVKVHRATFASCCDVHSCSESVSSSRIPSGDDELIKDLLKGVGGPASLITSMSSKLQASPRKQASARALFWSRYKLNSQGSKLKAYQQEAAEAALILQQKQGLEEVCESPRLAVEQKNLQIAQLQKIQMTTDASTENSCHLRELTKVSPLKNKWKITNILGSGGFGVVCEAVDLVNHHPTVVKMALVDSPNLLEVEKEVYESIYTGRQTVRGFP